MSNFKNNNGSASIILLIFAIIFLIFAIWFSLDIFGYIDVPKKYSLTRILDYTIESTYNENTVNNEKKVIKKVKEPEYDGDFDKIEIKKQDEITEEPESEKEEEGEEEEEVPFYNFYYNQLDNNGKKIYDKMISNIDNLKTGTYTIDFGKEFNDLLHTENGEEKLNNCFQSAVNAVLLDNPEIFYLDITKMYLLTKSTTYAFAGTTYQVSIGPSDGESYLINGYTKRDVEQAEQNLLEIKNKVLRKIKNKEPMEKIKEIHDYLVDNLEYDSTFENDNIYNVYGALVNNLTVCEGYAKAFKYLLKEVKIPCIIICGYATNSEGKVENHAWNDILVNGKWYGVDVTWDDPIIKGGGVPKKETKYRYFLKGAKTLFVDHKEDGEIVKGANFAYPNISREDY